MIYAGNDDMLADVLDLGEPGGILTGSHLFGEEMRRMVDEPERRREIDAGLQDVYRDLAIAPARLQHQGGAEPDRRPRRRARGFPTSSSTSARLAVVRAMLERHGMLATAAQRERRPLRVLPLGGLGEIGKNMTVVEYEGRIVVVDTGLRFPTTDMLGIDLVLPDFAYLRERADDIEAIVITHGHEDHLGALPWVLRELGGEARRRPSTAAR